MCCLCTCRASFGRRSCTPEVALLQLGLGAAHHKGVPVLLRCCAIACCSCRSNPGLPAQSFLQCTYPQAPSLHCLVGMAPGGQPGGCMPAMPGRAAGRNSFRALPAPWARPWRRRPRRCRSGQPYARGVHVPSPHPAGCAHRRRRSCSGCCRCRYCCCCCCWTARAAADCCMLATAIAAAWRDAACTASAQSRMHSPTCLGRRQPIV